MSEQEDPQEPQSPDGTEEGEAADEASPVDPPVGAPAASGSGHTADEPSGVGDPDLRYSACSQHEHVPAVGTCEHCGSFACGECLGDLGGRLICRACVVDGRVEVGLSPWDERKKLGLFAAWWATVKAVTLTPSDFFSRLAPSQFMGAAIGFALLAATPGQIANVIYNNLGNVLLFETLGVDLGQASGGDPFSQMLAPGSPVMIVLQVVMAPLTVIMNAMIYGLLAHLGLMIVGGTTKKLEASLKVACYAAAINFWMIFPVPYINAVVVGIWSMVVLAIGLMKMHNTTGAKAAFAVLWIPCLCGCAVGGIAAIAALAATQF